MEWAVWRPLYSEILKDFGFDPEADVRSAEILSNLVDKEQIPKFSAIVEKLGHKVSIFGASASLEDDSGKMPEGRTIVSAGSATGRLMRNGIRPDIIVTDLDGDARFDIEANALGALAFVHAHGDNIPAVRRFVPIMSGPIVPTVQCKPFGNVYNFGGFTDGDRAFFMVDHFGVNDVMFLGWDLENVCPKEGSDPVVKQRKLLWAQRLLKDRTTSIEGSKHMQER